MGAGEVLRRLQPAGPAGRQLLLGLGAGLVAGLLFAVGSSFNPFLGAVALLALIVAIVFVVRPDWGAWIFLYLILVIEEFPSGYGETVQRSLRTPFYSYSLGIHGFYSTDLLLLVLLILYGLRSAMKPRKHPFRPDGIWLGLVLVMGMMALSTLISLLFGDPFSHGVVMETTGTAFKVNARGAELIAFFQMKIYLYIFLSYMLGVFYLEDERDISRVIGVFLAAALTCLFLGFKRLVMYPEKIMEMIPLFYHSPSSWVFALTAFYTVLAWGTGRLRGRKAMWMIILSLILMLFVLLSFRRTLWAAIFLAAILLLFFLPSKARIRVILVGLAFVVAGGIAMLVTTAGQDVLQAVAGRIEETGVQDTSTLYRLALFVYMAHHIWDIPLFGYGAMPLWNKMVSLGYFRTNLENIHSLYFWLILRTGIIGLLVFLTAAVSFVVRIGRFIRTTADAHYRIIAICVLLALLMLGFSGVFNPVYGEARYMILMGFGLAMISRMAQFEEAAKLPGAPRVHP